MKFDTKFIQVCLLQNVQSLTAVCNENHVLVKCRRTIDIVNPFSGECKRLIFLQSMKGNNFHSW